MGKQDPVGGKGSLPAKRRRALMNRTYREHLLSLDRSRLSSY
ncbi:MAG: hypothetical protein ACKVKH_15965 [Verrucomicrobiales bacterium]